MNDEDKLTGCIGMVILFVVIIIFCFGWDMAWGINGFGPVNSHVVTINNIYVEHDGKHASHYMVGTDQGSFEVDNGWILGMWNSDEIYGKLAVGHTYKIRTKGNRQVGWFMQDYPYITQVEEN